jgi:hypothetical protein
MTAIAILELVWVNSRRLADPTMGGITHVGCASRSRFGGMLFESYEAAP